MRIRPIVEVADRHSLKPVPGDTVLYEGDEYIVMEVGVRWVYMYLTTDPKKTKKMAKINLIVKKPVGAEVQA